MAKKVKYSVDIDTTNGDNIRDYEFSCYDKAKAIFDKYVGLKKYKDSLIDNIQLIRIETNGDWDAIECKFYDHP